MSLGISNRPPFHIVSQRPVNFEMKNCFKRAYLANVALTMEYLLLGRPVVTVDVSSYDFCRSCREEELQSVKLQASFLRLNIWHPEKASRSIYGPQGIGTSAGAKVLQIQFVQRMRVIRILSGIKMELFDGFYIRTCAWFI